MGHLHLYVDGAKHTRLYGSWFYLDGLAPGAHALRVEAGTLGCPDCRVR